MIYSIIVLILGFYVLVKGADWFVDGASSLAGIFHVSQLVIGLTICAMGTSLPEAAVSMVAGLQGNAGITIGNVVGSNILNILLILGITSLISKIAIEKSTRWFEIPYMLLSTLILLIMGLNDQEVTLIEGIILWMMFILYLLYLFYLAKKEDQEQAIVHYSLLGCLFLIILGIFFVIVGSQLVVKSATHISTLLHLSQRFIGLTIVAFGTSLPELVTSLQAARKGNDGIAIGNIVGSNIFNILFIVGSVSLICPIPFEKSFVVDTLVAGGSGVLLWLLTLSHHELRRISGMIMLIAYMLYFIYLC